MSSYYFAAAGTAFLPKINGASLKYKTKRLLYRMDEAAGAPGTIRYRSPANVRMYR